MIEIDNKKMWESLVKHGYFNSINEAVVAALNDQGLKYDYDKNEIVSVKSEPKFKVGDWIACNGTHCIGQIKEVIYTHDGYAYDHTNGYFHDVFDNMYHRWTINDARDGDILCNPRQKIVCIFKKLNDVYNTFLCYACIEKSRDNSISKDTCLANTASLSIEGFLPATPEQSKMLFSSLKIAGYMWDPDKKQVLRREDSTSDKFKKAVDAIIDEDIKKAYGLDYVADQLSSILREDNK